MLGLNFDPNYEFGNSEAYYGLLGLYTGPGPNVDPTREIGS